MRRNIEACASLMLVGLAATLVCGPALAGPMEDCKSHSSLVSIKGCTALILSNPNNPNAYLQRGEAYRTHWGADNYDRAIADYTQMIRLSPDRADAFFGRAQAYEDKKDYDRAIADYGQVLRRNPNFANGFYRRGVSHFYKKDYDDAIADLGEAIRLDPDLVYSLHLRGDAYRQKGDYVHAIAEYSEQFLRRPPTGQELKDRAIAYLLVGDYDHAIADFDAVAQDGVFFVAIGLYGRGVARLGKGDVAGGHANIAAALARDAGMAEKFAREGVAPPSSERAR